MDKVNAHHTGLHKGNAQWMVILAREAYKCKPDKTPDTKNILSYLLSLDPGFLSVQGFSNETSQAILVGHTDYVCMAFRGSDEKGDWKHNFNARQIDMYGGQFHTGFVCAIRDIWDELFVAYVDLMHEKRRPLFITGHSLGGAMTTMAAVLLLNDGVPFTSAYTFGQPRVMGKATARVFNAECKERFFRVCNNNDVITRVPTRNMKYTHVGTYLHIDVGGRIHLEPGVWFRFLDRIRGATAGVFEKGIDHLEDHDIADYYDAIVKWKYRG